MLHAKWLRVLFFGTVLAVVTGCSGGMFAPTTGRLVYPDGRPARELANGQVVFESLGPNGKSYSSVGNINAEGGFVLATDHPADGAVVGKNRVLIIPHVPNPDRPPPRVLNPRYEAFETSGIELEVKPGRNEFTITVEPASPGKL